VREDHRVRVESVPVVHQRGPVPEAEALKDFLGRSISRFRSDIQFLKQRDIKPDTSHVARSFSTPCREVIGKRKKELTQDAKIVTSLRKDKRRTSMSSSSKNRLRVAFFPVARWRAMKLSSEVFVQFACGF
jgi:hypothetical protein